MRNRYVIWTISMVIVAGLLVAVTTHFAQTPAPAYRAPRTADAKPNLSGVWQALNEANWDLEAHAARAGAIVQDGAHPLAKVPAAPSLPFGAVGSVPGSIGVVEGGTIPYQPWAAAQKKDNQEHWL